MIDDLQDLLNEIDLQGTLGDEFSVIRFVQGLSPEEYRNFNEILALPEGGEIVLAFMQYTDYTISKIMALLKAASRYRTGAIQIDLTKGEQELNVIPFSRN